ncbi:MAG: ATPase, T2SS/T4P/T4SS family [Candidatus Omnitrophota bacterium]
MVKNTANNLIGAILLRSKKIDEKQLSAAVEEKNGNTRVLLGEIITRKGFASPADIAQALSEQLNIPYVELGEDVKLELDEIRLIPEAIARKFCIVPFKKADNVITIVMKDPLDINAVDTVRTLTNLEVQKAVNSEDKIVAAINKYYAEEAHIERNLQDIVELENGKGIEGVIEETRVDSDHLRILANDAPVVRFVNLLLLQAVRDGASDIHFEPGEKEVSVRLRVDGKLRNVTPPPKALYPAIVTRIKILSKMNIAERRLPQDGRFKFKVDKSVLDIRVSSLPEACGEKIVMRVLDRSAMLADMNDLGLETETLKSFQRILKEPHGIILLTGPTGSGKTTTLYSALNFIKTPELNIQTVEDPIEYFVEGVNQMQTKSDIDLTFANALRSILRQDPDIIMIGEMRDLETARISMRAALTGHLVLSTLHTNDATSAFNRLKDIGIEPYLVAATVNLVISQRLVRVICDKCKEEVIPPHNSLKAISQFKPDIHKWTHYKGKGCKECSNTGYKGRTGIFEFLEVTDTIKEMISEARAEGALRKKAIQMGMGTLLDSGFRKVKDGVTTIEEVLSVCPPPENT